jgi:hypothetical protein
MTFPIHSVKHVKDDYNRYQIISTVLILITLAAALATAISGVQLAKLQKAQLAVQTPTSDPRPVVEEPSPDEAMVREVEKLKSALEAEQTRSKTLSGTIAKLKAQIEKTKAAVKEKAQKIIAVPPADTAPQQVLQAPVQGGEPDSAEPKTVTQPKEMAPVSVQPVPQTPSSPTPVKKMEVPKTPSISAPQKPSGQAPSPPGEQAPLLVAPADSAPPQQEAEPSTSVKVPTAETVPSADTVTQKAIGLDSQPAAEAPVIDPQTYPSTSTEETSAPAANE